MSSEAVAFSTSRSNIIPVWNAFIDDLLKVDEKESTELIQIEESWDDNPIEVVIAVMLDHRMNLLTPIYAMIRTLAPLKSKEERLVHSILDDIWNTYKTLIGDRAQGFFNKNQDTETDFAKEWFSRVNLTNVFENTPWIQYVEGKMLKPSFVGTLNKIRKTFEDATTIHISNTNKRSSPTTTSTNATKRRYLSSNHLDRESSKLKARVRRLRLIRSWVQDYINDAQAQSYTISDSKQEYDSFQTNVIQFIGKIDPMISQSITLFEHDQAELLPIYDYIGNCTSVIKTTLQTMIADLLSSHHTNSVSNLLQFLGDRSHQFQQIYTRNIAKFDDLEILKTHQQAIGEYVTQRYIEQWFYYEESLFRDIQIILEQCQLHINTTTSLERTANELITDFIVIAKQQTKMANVSYGAIKHGSTCQTAEQLQPKVLNARTPLIAACVSADTSKYYMRVLDQCRSLVQTNHEKNKKTIQQIIPIIVERLQSCSNPSLSDSDLPIHRALFQNETAAIAKLKLSESSTNGGSIKTVLMGLKSIMESIVRVIHSISKEMLLKTKADTMNVIHTNQFQWPVTLQQEKCMVSIQPLFDWLKPDQNPHWQKLQAQIHEKLNDNTFVSMRIIYQTVTRFHAQFSKHGVEMKTQIENAWRLVLAIWDLENIIAGNNNCQ